MMLPTTKLTTRMVFLSMTKMPSTVKPTGSPVSRLRNTFICQKLNKYTRSIVKVLDAHQYFRCLTFFNLPRPATATATAATAATTATA